MAKPVAIYIREAIGQEVQPIDCYWWKCPECKRRDISRGYSFCPRYGIELRWILDDLKEDK